MKAMGYAQQVIESISYNTSNGVLSWIGKKSGENSGSSSVNIKEIKVNNSGYADSAGRATNDVNNDRIDDTYAKKSDLLNAIYPVGSIYISTNNNSPQNFLGGTWVRIEGKFLLGAGSGYNAGSTGGEATHTLKKEEMPWHNHAVQHAGRTDTHGGGYYLFAGSTRVTASSQTMSVETRTTLVGTRTDYEGSGNAHNNMPPYLAVYIWKRTA